VTQLNSENEEEVLMGGAVVGHTDEAVYARCAWCQVNLFREPISDDEQLSHRMIHACIRHHNTIHCAREGNA